MTDRIKLGVSTCLLGEKVRYDGGHKHDPFITATLGRHVDLVPVCPEFECGLGVPREPMRLEGDPAAPRLVTIKTRRDLTDIMQAWCTRRVAELEAEGLHGYLFKSRSPSSGMERVKVYNPNGGPAAKKGVGLFARAFMQRFPNLPVEEEGRLNDARLRENFIERLFALRRFRELLAEGRDRGGLVDFHSRHKLQLMAHSPDHYRSLGRLVAEARSHRPRELFETYERLFFQALRLHASIPKNTNVLQHMLGYFKKTLDPDEKQELLEVIERYRRGMFPLIVPITLVAHHVRKHSVLYLARQTYLQPHPAELMLRNHV